MTGISVGIPFVDAALQWVLGLLAGWGYPIVFAATVLENLFVIGSVTPGEIIVMASAFVAEKGVLSVPVLWIASVLGTTVGSNVSYFLGRRGGLPWLQKYGHRFHIPEKRLIGAEEYFARYGSKTVFLARFAAVFKNFVPVIAGVSRMPIAWFELYTVLGAVVYTTLMIVIGYAVGENLELGLRILGRLGWVGTALLVVMVALLVFGRRRLRRKRLAVYGTVDEGEHQALAEEDRS